VIEPQGLSLVARIIEAWRARSLLVFFGHRAAEQIVSRTLLGYLWLVLRPGIPAAVMVFVFGFLIQVDTAVETPYLIFFLLGLTAWNAFDSLLIWGTRGLYFNRSLLSKMYFPRLLVPIASMFPGIMEFAIHAVFLIVALVGYVVLRGEYHAIFSIGVIWAAGALAAAFALATGLCLFTSLWDYQARDTRYTISVISRFLLYLTPVIYPSTNIPEAYRVYYFVNPIAGIVETFRYGVLGRLDLIPVGAFAYSCGFAALALLAGLIYFSIVESSVIDRA